MASFHAILIELMNFKLIGALCCLPLTISAQTIVDVYNSASFDTRLSPGVLAAVYGTNLGTTTSTVVTVGGEAAAVLYASANQFSVQIPVMPPSVLPQFRWEAQRRSR